MYLFSTTFVVVFITCNWKHNGNGPFKDCAALFVHQVMPRVAATSRDEGRACGPTDPGDCRSVLLGKCTFLVAILP